MRGAWIALTLALFCAGCNIADDVATPQFPHDDLGDSAPDADAPSDLPADAPIDAPDDADASADLDAPLDAPLDADMPDPDMTCVPEDDDTFCARVGAQCGQTEGVDNCGMRRVSGACGDCNTDESCQGGMCVCPIPTCPAGAVCGDYTNTCGATVQCGTCPGSDSCDPTTRQCVACIPEADDALCASANRCSGNLSILDRCGDMRTVTCDCLVKRLVPGDPAAREFGSSVAAEDNRALIGAPARADLAAPGAAYVFTRQHPAAWTQAHRYTSPEPLQQTFAAHVAFAQGNALMTDPLRAGSGSACCLGELYTGWVDTGQWFGPTTHRPNEVMAEHRFGSALAARGEWAVVGTSVRSAFFYRRSGLAAWSQHNRIFVQPGPLGDVTRFAETLAMANTLTLVGAPGYPNNLNQTIGGVFVYGYSTAQQGWDYSTQVLPLALANQPDSGFGAALAATDVGVFFVGAPAWDDGMSSVDRGAVVIFTGAGAIWSGDTKINNPSPELGTSFGAALAATDAYLVVGAPTATSASLPNAGAIYLYSFTPQGSVNLVATLNAPQPSAEARFGSAVAIAGDMLVVGAPGEGAQGAAYVFDMNYLP